MSGLAGRRVLVVEDEPIVGMLLEDMLLDLGVEVVGPAATLAEALALAEREDLAAALLDVNLGGERSYPVADALARRGVPFLFLTGYGEAAWEGPALTIQKPYRSEDVAAGLERVLAPMRRSGEA
jgi:CheY-like chemotaxis protein